MEEKGRKRPRMEKGGRYGLAAKLRRPKEDW